MRDNFKNKMNKCRFCGKETKNRVYCNRKCQGEGYKEQLKGENNPFFGKKHDAETMRKIQEKRAKQTMPLRIPRETRFCKICGDSFVVKVNSEKQYCHRQKCIGKAFGYQKGHIPWITGKTKETNESVMRISENTSKTQKGVPEKDWVKRQTSEVITQLYVDRPELRDICGSSMRGKHHKEETKVKMRVKAKRGENHPRFNPNKPECERYHSDCQFHFNLGNFSEEFDLNKVRKMCNPKNKKWICTRSYVFYL